MDWIAVTIYYLHVTWPGKARGHAVAIGSATHMYSHACDDMSIPVSKYKVQRKKYLYSNRLVYGTGTLLYGPIILHRYSGVDGEEIYVHKMTFLADDIDFSYIFFEK